MVDPPHPPADSGSAESLFLAWLDQDARGGASSFEDLCARHPEQAEHFALLRAAHDRAASVFRRLAQPGERAQPAPAAPLPDVVAPPRYELKSEIARGGMGTIFEVYDPNLRRTVAMKVLRRDRAHSAHPSGSDLARRQSRLLSEAQILAQLDHPGVVAVHEMGLDEHGRAYFTMKRVRGQDFSAVISAHADRSEEWRLSRVIGVLVRVCEAVAYAHQKGVIHRDLKPSNVLVGRFGEVFVMDWGLAKTIGHAEAAPVPLVHATLARDPSTWPGPSTDEGSRAEPSVSLVRTSRDLDSSSSESSPLATLAGEVVGTPAYMPPEQARGELGAVDARADVYAIGAMLYHILAGRHPYADKRAAGAEGILTQVLIGPPTPLDEIAKHVPEELVAICDRAMARIPSERYQTMLEFADELRAFLEDRVVRAHRTGAWIEMKKWVRRNRWAAATIGVLILATVGVAVVQSVLRRDIETAQRETMTRAEALRRQGYLQGVGLAAGAWKEGRAGRARELLDQCPADLRAWEWRFLDPRIDTSVRTIQLDYSRNRSACFGPDDHSIIVSGPVDRGGSPITHFEADSGFPLCQVESELRNLSISADGSRLLAIAPGREIRIWDTSTWARLPGIEVEMSGPWPGVVCSPKGSLVAVGGSGPIEIWDFVTRERVGILECGVDHCTGSWSPDATRFYSYSRDRGLATWDVRTCGLLDCVPETRGTLGGVNVSPDGRWLGTSNELHQGVVRDSRTLEIVHRTESLRYGAFYAWSPDSSRVALGDGPNILVLSTRTWTTLSVLTGHAEPLNNLMFDRSGERLLSCSFDGAVKLWDMRQPPGEFRREPPSSAVDLRFSWDGKRVAVFWGTAGTVEVWSTDQRELIRSFPVVSGTNSMDLDADGRTLLLPADGHSLRLADVDDGSTKCVIPGETRHTQPLKTSILRFSPDGSRLSALGKDCSLSVWDRRSNRWTWFESVADAAPDTWPRPVFGGEWSPDSRLLVTMPRRGQIQLFDADTGVRIREWTSRMPCAKIACFSPDSRRLYLAGDFERGLECWEVNRGELVWERGPDFATAMALGDGGTRLLCVAANHTVDVRDAGTGQEILTLELDPDLNYGFGMSPVDDTLVSASVSGLRFWDTRPHRAHSPRTAVWR